MANLTIIADLVESPDGGVGISLENIKIIMEDLKSDIPKSPAGFKFPGLNLIPINMGHGRLAGYDLVHSPGWIRSGKLLVRGQTLTRALDIVIQGEHGSLSTIYNDANARISYLKEKEVLDPSVENICRDLARQNKLGVRLVSDSYYKIGCF
jgi:hypothetical protein